MAPKRVRSSPLTSAANVASKHQRVGRELASAAELDEKLEREREAKRIYEEILRSPVALQKAKMALKSETVSWGRATHLNPDLEGRQLSRLPPTFVLEFLRGRGIDDGFLREQAKLKDAKALHKLLCFVCGVSLSQKVGPLEKKVWIELYNKRADMVGNLSEGSLPMTDMGDVDYAKCGHYAFEPPLADIDSEALSSHVFKGLDFRGHFVPFNESDYTVRSSWRLEQNYSHLDACVVNPAKPWMKFVAADLFKEKLSELLSPMAVDLPRFPAVCDGTVDDDEEKDKGERKPFESPKGSSNLLASRSSAAAVSSPLALRGEADSGGASSSLKEVVTTNASSTLEVALIPGLKRPRLRRPPSSDPKRMAFVVDVPASAASGNEKSTNE